MDSAELLWEAIGLLPERCDAVVMDEGQDFHPTWWAPIDLINVRGDEGFLYVFYDHAQNLCNELGVIMLSLSDPKSLKTNCRNTRAIAVTCGRVIGRTIDTNWGAQAGLDADCRGAGDPADHGAVLNSWLSQWIKVEGCGPQRWPSSVPTSGADCCLPVANSARV